jgi:CRP-like cAMP-binding protein
MIRSLYYLEEEPLSAVHQTLIRKLKEHSRLTSEDVAAINAIGHTVRKLESNEDLIRQGDDPDASAVVLSGFVARYHLLQDGGRQYLSFHMAGDMPDSQALFIDRMDHAVCAIGPALVALLPHKELLAAFNRRPSIAFAIWRETLIDAAIFREAITNNSARSMPARMGHLFCELFYRARASGLTRGNTLLAPISLLQLGETLAMSIATVNRTLQDLRASRAVSFRRGRLQINSWKHLVEISQFRSDYLHQNKTPHIF